MPAFKDKGGNSWSVELNVAAIKRVRSLINVDLMEVLEGKLIDKLMTDPVLLVDVIYCVVKPEADKRNITDEQFGELMAGDAIEHATQALMESIVLFIPSPKDRASFKRILAKMNEGMDKARDLTTARLDSQLDNIVEQAVQQAISGN